MVSGWLVSSEIIQERIEREYDLDVLFTAPSVEYEVVMYDGETIPVDSPATLPDESKMAEIREPWMNIEIITPTDYYGPIMELVTKRRGSSNNRNIPRRIASSLIMKSRSLRSLWISSTT